ncbi:hypothetical protein MHU86_1966 [Fragilaria crotonensis]|nr:hypothetical protein MHU86_1966 [Fragilaria crotonensis]
MIRVCIIIVLCGNLIPWIVLIILSNVNAVTVSISESIASEQRTEESTKLATISSRHEQCSIYIAPSTIPGAGQGVFTSKPIANGTVIGIPDFIIPIIDLEFNHPSLILINSNDSCWMLHDYVWNGDTMMGMHREGGNTGALAPGFDAAVNSYIETAGNATTTTTTTTSSSSRFNPIGITIPISQKNDTPAGAELFKDYGQEWFASREALAKHQGDGDDVVKNDDSPSLDEVVRNNNVDQKINLEVQHRDNIRDKLPDMPDSRCLESIVPRPSTIEGAGRGGFATWSFQKGQVITGSPLIHIPDRKKLELYNLDDDDTNETSMLDHVAPKLYGHQLLMKYCWGHPKTNLLLCPYGAGINLLNHSRERANVMIQWAPHGHLAQNDAWFYICVTDMNSCKANLAWDYVAVRDIAQGEELFIDYGDAWRVNAWEAHVAACLTTKWRPPTTQSLVRRKKTNYIDYDSRRNILTSDVANLL